MPQAIIVIGIEECLARREGVLLPRAVIVIESQEYTLATSQYCHKKSGELLLQAIIIKEGQEYFCHKPLLTGTLLP